MGLLLFSGARCLLKVSHPEAFNPGYDRKGKAMKIMQTTIVLLAAGAGVSWSAVSLDIRKPPVTLGAGAGPNVDPNADRGQWFGSGTVRPYEFHDNLVGFGGGAASTNAIKGVVTNITNDGQGGITAFSIQASITNDTNTATAGWMNGTSSHGEQQTATIAYVGTMFSTKLVAEFAMTDLINKPAAWAYPYKCRSCRKSPPQTRQTPHGTATAAVAPAASALPAWDFGAHRAGPNGIANAHIHGERLHPAGRHAPRGDHQLVSQWL